jgi:hypothetical protein
MLEQLAAAREDIAYSYRHSLSREIGSPRLQSMGQMMET